MANQNPNMPGQTEQEPFIPPYYLVLVALFGLLVAGVVFLTQPTFNVVGWGGLGIAFLSLLAWVGLAPQQARAVLTGRTVRYGGLSLVVTGAFLIMLVLVYILVRDQNWRIDLTQTDQYSLTETSRAAIVGLGVDPNQPNVKLTAFYGASQAGRRDRDELLFQDYATASNGKISYEFVDPERNPALTTQYGITSAGQISVAVLNAEGQPDIENDEIVSFFSQDELTNAILRVSASGDFRAYFLNVDGGLQLEDRGPSGMSILNDTLVDTFDWNTQQVSVFQLTGANSEIKLNDQTADGEVIVIAGGNTPLSDEELKVITDFVDNGGSLVIFASPSIAASTNDAGESSIAGNQPLALAENLSTYLYDNFGMRFVDDVVLDPTLSIQSPLVPVATDLSASSYVTTSGISRGSGIVFEIPRSIEISPVLPANVTLEELARTSPSSYSKTDIQAVLNGEIDQLDTDAKGPFVLAAAAENTETGARVILFGSSGVPANNFASFSSGLVNLPVSFNSLVWSTRFNDFFQSVTVQSPVSDQDAPIFASDQVIRNVNLLTVVVIPFGILAIGLLVWWRNRERAPHPVAVPNQE
jgi:hypothetical protein